MPRSIRSRMLVTLAAAFCLAPGCVFSEWVERPDAMHWHRLADYDVHEGRVRVLYYTNPSLQQARQPDAAINVYIAELYPDGRIENRRLASGKRHFAALLLQRGGDGVFAVVAPDEGATGNKLEYWSARDGTLRATSNPAGLESSIHGIFPTDDGNFFTVSQSAQSSRGDRPTTLTMTKHSPQGEVLASGQWQNPTAKAVPAGAFAVPGGGMGLTVDLTRVRGADVLDTDIEAAQRFEIGGRTIEARVFSETRMLATDASGNVLWQSPALERDLSWDGEMSIPQDLPMDERMAQNKEQMALMSRVRLKNGGDRRLEHLATAGLDDVQKTSNGYGILATVTADRRLQPPQHGMWYLEVGEDGALRRELRIEPAAERLEAKFERFMPTADGGLLVAGVRRAGETGLHLTALNREGDIEWTARLGIEDAKIEGIAGNDAAPWVFGHGFSEAGNKNLMWAELVDTASASALPAAAAKTATPRPRPRAVPEMEAPPTLELPEPAEGCECTCEEFAAIQELTQRMKSMPQAEMMAIVSDPSYQARMNCMGGCAMAYANCR